MHRSLVVVLKARATKLVTQMPDHCRSVQYGYVVRSGREIPGRTLATCSVNVLMAIGRNGRVRN